ncbi:MAG: radical SAM family heme chaperone HemW [Nitrospirae bacterium]|nr:radical SAM family heme chaperone HemW [Magnetococcales bacterium]
MFPPSFSIYVHVPFCHTKCHYCAFDSIPSRPAHAFTSWRKAILADLNYQAKTLSHHPPRPVTSIFFGGGTPSLLPPAIIGEILQHIQQFWPLNNQTEITLEANPESTTPAKLHDWRSLGINRLSLGIQALDDRRLSLLGRPHTTLQARQVFAESRKAGFETINLDLIHSSPGHTPHQWQEELSLAMELNPEHISCYALTIEPGTPLERQLNAATLQLPTDETAATLYQLTQSVLEQHGWNRYEISNYARQDHLCRHNLAIWLSGDYLGVGPAAHGKMTHQDGAIIRTHNHWPLEGYIHTQKHHDAPFQWVELSSPEEAAADCLIMGLRLVSGIPRQLYREVAGADLMEKKSAEVDFLVKEGLLLMDPTSIRLSPRGLDFLDTCLTWLI